MYRQVPDSRLVREAVRYREISREKRIFGKRKKQKREPHLATLDLETNGFHGEVLGGALYAGPGELYYTDKDDGDVGASVWGTLLELGEKYRYLRVFAHNARFDLSHLLESIPSCFEERFNVEIANVGARYIFRMVEQTHKGERVIVEIYDSMAFFPKALDKLEKEFGIERDTSEVKKYRNDMLRLFRENRSLFKKYLFEDVQNLYKILEETNKSLQEITGLDGFLLGPSPASTTMYVFQRRYLKEKVITNLSFPQYTIMRNSYFGGRVEVFRHRPAPGEKVYAYDFTSLYPTVMRELEVPLKGLRSTNEYEPGKPGWYQIWFRHSPDCSLECIPCKVHDGSSIKLMFPRSEDGMFAWVTNWDIESQLEADPGFEFEVVMGYVSDCTARIFEGFVNELFELKRRTPKSDYARYSMTKVLLNSCYGKFGQKGVRRSYVLNEGIFEPRETYNFPSFFHPGIAGLVTAAARFRLNRVLSRLIKAGEKVFYCDTDSIFTTASPDRLREVLPEIELDTGNLGGLAFEGEFEKCLFIAPKMYYCLGSKERKAKFKGFNGNDEEVIEVLNAIWNEGKFVVKVEQNRFLGRAFAPNNNLELKGAYHGIERMEKCYLRKHTKRKDDFSDPFGHLPAITDGEIEIDTDPLFTFMREVNNLEKTLRKMKP